MIYWRYVNHGQFILQAWADRADKTLNEFITDCGKYDLCFGRDAYSTECRQCYARECWYGGGDFDLVTWGLDYGVIETNELHGLWMHRVMCSGFTDFDSFHCFECEVDEDACQFCPHCGIAERYEIQAKIRQGYKGGYEICKDWEDLDKYGL